MVHFFQKYSNNIYIISGGFQEWILPIVLKYSILKKNVFANKFKFDKNGKIIGYDQKNPLSQGKGKVRIIKKLNLKQ